eukprot:TRINITY_DN19574_c0_g1_i1.p1 TRINITY_DN19574_c0_g1~~TRINITY_DN19574_c0_g1_i1.p1  ORF type:complete len:133 (-),score=33.55 TRINITY_DN19574_c0_g1_i1:8-406(-)
MPLPPVVVDQISVIDFASEMTVDINDPNVSVMPDDMDWEGLGIEEDDLAIFDDTQLINLARRATRAAFVARYGEEANRLADLEEDEADTEVQPSPSPPTLRLTTPPEEKSLSESPSEESPKKEYRPPTLNPV